MDYERYTNGSDGNDAQYGYGRSGFDAPLRPEEDPYTDNVAEQSEPEEEIGVDETEEQPVAEYDPYEEMYDMQQPIVQKVRGKANIVVAGVGGGGNNAVNNMIRAGIKSANFIVMNTDLQALTMSLVPPRCKIQLGEKTTGGLGAGSDPEIGKRAAEESKDRIKAALQGVDLLFITAGMGGGTGTGAAPVVAQVANSMNILTVAVVTKPFDFEGVQRMRNAEMGIANLKNYVDTILVIPNQKLPEVLGKKISIKNAFIIADDVLRQGVQGVSDVIANPEIINLDFADVRTVLSHKGLAHMGVGHGSGEKGVMNAVREAVYSPLIETDIEGATGIIVNISCDEDMPIGEIEEAGNLISQVVDPSANIIFGTDFVKGKEEVEITIIATGFDDKHAGRQRPVGGAQIVKPLSEAFGEVAADDNRRGYAEASVEAERANVNPDLFANRPNLSWQRERDAQKALKEKAAQDAILAAEREKAAAEEAQRAAAETAQREAAQREAQKEEIRSSRVDVSANKVPAFLRRLKRDDK